MRYLNHIFHPNDVKYQGLKYGQQITYSLTNEHSKELLKLPYLLLLLQQNYKITFIPPPLQQVRILSIVALLTIFRLDEKMKFRWVTGNTLITPLKLMKAKVAISYISCGGYSVVFRWDRTSFNFEF